MRMKQQQLDDPATLGLYREIAEAISWPADDPRLTGLRDQLVALLEVGEAEGAIDDAEMSDDLAQLLDSVFLDSVPIAPRLLELLEERGWRGWTKLERMPAG